jgi:tetratricopeptide (TPR) repeat protein
LAGTEDGAAAPTVAELLQHGMQQHQSGRLDQAETAYRQALTLAPHHADGQHLLGVIAYQRGRHGEAVVLIRAAIRQRADRGRYHGNLGLALQALGRLDEAAAAYRESVRLEPGFVQGFNNLGNILRRTGHHAEAEQAFRRALAVQPDQAEIWNNLATALHQQIRLAEAEAAYRRAIGLKPGLAEAHFGLGYVLFDLGRPAEAEAACQAGLALRPESPDGLHGLGNAQFRLGRQDEAEARYRQALSIDPAHAKVHFNLAHLLLQAGRLEEGWAHFEWRTASHGAGRRDFVPPLWDGQPLAQGTLLVHAEQGLGDTLQFCRYLPLVAARARLVVEVQRPLVRLIAGLSGIAEIVVRGEALPPFAAHCPMMSLPRLFGTVLETIPAEIPYLAADPAAVARWRDRLAALPGLRVGLVWAGGVRPDQPEQAAIDGRRSIGLARLAPLAAVPGVSFVSLQKGPPAAQATTPPRGMALHDFTAELDDFADTAALVEALDLVISVDTAVVHLAGALGKPVWVLNRFDTCWRWLRDRTDSPWYPSLRLFAQTAPGDWDGVVASVATALRQVVTAG